MRIRRPDTRELYDLDREGDQRRLFLSEKTAKLEGSVITEPLFRRALARAEAIPDEALVEHVWFGQLRTRYHCYGLSPSGRGPTPAQEEVLRLLGRHFPTGRVWHDGQEGFLYQPASDQPGAPLDLERRLQAATRKRVGAVLENLDASFVQSERAMQALRLAREAGIAVPFLLERCFANSWLSRYYGFTPPGGSYVPLVYDVDLFVPYGGSLLAVEVKQKNPMRGRPLRVGLNRGEAKLLAALQDAGCRPVLVYLLKKGQEEPARLLEDERLIRSSCWVAAEVDARSLVRSGRATVRSGRHTSLGGTTTAPSYALPLAEHFHLLSPSERAADIRAIDGERLSRFLEQDLPLVKDEEVMRVWGRG